MMLISRKRHSISRCSRRYIAPNLREKDGTVGQAANSLSGILRLGRMGGGRREPLAPFCERPEL